MCVVCVYVCATHQGIMQQLHSPSSPQGQLTQPVLIVLTGLEREEVVLDEEMLLPGMLGGYGRARWFVCRLCVVFLLLYAYGGLAVAEFMDAC